MKFPHPLVRGYFLKREKRFFIYAQLDDGRQVIAHTNNTGRMSGCLAPGARVWLSPADNPARKLKWTLEMVETVEDQETGLSGGILVGVNTALANKLVAEALTSGRIPALSKYTEIKAEVGYGTRGSRADFRLTGLPDEPDRPCWVEVKNVTLVTGSHARFPDAPSERGRKHLLELADRVRQGDRATLVFCIQREDARTVGPADDIDPEYGVLLREVAAVGVEIRGARCRLTHEFIEIIDSIPLSML